MNEIPTNLFVFNFTFDLIKFFKCLYIILVCVNNEYKQKASSE